MKKEILSDGLILYSFEWDYIASQMYVIIADDNMLIVDPIYTEEVSEYMETQKDKKVTIILTHEHFDHINGVNWFKMHFDCTVYANTVCAQHICLESKNLSNHSEVIMMFNNNVNPNNVVVTPFTCSADVIFEGRMKLEWLEHEIEMVTTPGHTDGSICIFFDEKYIFTGDTLLDIPTITRLPGGSRKKFYDITIPYLKSISNINYRVFPGHGDAGTLQDMLAQYQ